MHLKVKLEVGNEKFELIFATSVSGPTESQLSSSQPERIWFPFGIQKINEYGVASGNGFVLKRDVNIKTVRFIWFNGDCIKSLKGIAAFTDQESYTNCVLVGPGCICDLELHPYYAVFIFNGIT